MTQFQLTVRPALQLLLVVAVVCGMSAITSAQTDSSSHRRLELPAGGSADLQRQMQMLLQLQGWLGDKKLDPSTTKPGMSPEQLKMLRQAMEQLGGNLPQGAMPDLSNIPPELISGVLSDPGARQQIKDMLEQYNRTRQMPAGRPGAGPPVTPRRGNRPQDAENSNTRQNQSPDTATSPPRPGNRTPGDSANQSAIEQIQERFNELQQRINPQNSRPPQTTPTQERGQPALPSNAEDWPGFLQELIEEQQRTGETTPLTPGELPPQAETNRPQNRLRPGNRRGADPSGTAPSNSANGQPGNSNVAQFLKQLQDLPPAEIPKELLPQPATAETPQPGSPTPTDTTTQPGTSAAELRQKQEQTKSSLEQNGLQSTIRNIVQEARQQARSDGPGKATGNNGAQAASGIEGSVIRALDGIRKDIVEIAKDAKFKMPKPQPAGRSASPGNKTVKTPDAPQSGWKKSTTEFFSNLATTPGARSATASFNPASPNPMLEGGGSSSFPGGLILLLAIVVATVVLWKVGRVGSAGMSPATGWRGVPSDIRSRQDVIKAFHQLALHPERETESWWTHQKVAETMSENSPEMTAPAATLSALYEQARYLPGDMEFDEAQIAAAKIALKQCKS